MMKKYIALCLALVLALGLTACGAKEDKKPTQTTTTTTTTTEGVSDGTTTAAPTDGTTTTTAADSTTSGSSTTATTTTTTTTAYVPGGVTVPIGTRPTTTTTTTAPTTTTTTTVVSPSGNTTSGSTTATTTTTTTTTTSTTVTTTTTTTGVQHYIALPEIGFDIDIKNKKNRIRVSAATAWFNTDGTIGVSLTFKNYTSNWITEETDYVQYTCYDKNGKVVQRATKIMIGVIDTKKNREKTFEFSVPADTAEVRITKSKIVYWTEWA